MILAFLVDTNNEVFRQNVALSFRVAILGSVEQMIFVFFLLLHEFLSTFLGHNTRDHLIILLFQLVLYTVKLAFGELSALLISDLIVRHLSVSSRVIVRRFLVLVDATTEKVVAISATYEFVCLALAEHEYIVVLVDASLTDGPQWLLNHGFLVVFF